MRKWGDFVAGWSLGWRSHSAAIERSPHILLKSDRLSHSNRIAIASATYNPIAPPIYPDRSLRGKRALPETVSASRRKHRESDVWQRRFWEHTMRDERDLQRHLDYIHFNPVKHGLVSCPHLWEWSSFHRCVGQGKYAKDWGCAYGGR